MASIPEWGQHIIYQVKTLLTEPKELFRQTKGEAMTPMQVYLAYLLPLSIIPAVAVFLGSLLIGFWGFSLPFGESLKMGLMMYVGVVVAGTLFSLILATLSPIYGGERNIGAAFTLVAISFVPAFFLLVLWIWPAFGLFATAAGLACLYFVYCGLESFLKVPEERRVVFLLVSFVATALVFMFLVKVFGAITTPSAPSIQGLPVNIKITGSILGL